MGHGHLQHTGAGGKGNNCLRYHKYISTVRNTLRYAIGFAYGASLKVRNGKKSLMGRMVDLNSVEGDQEEEEDGNTIDGENGDSGTFRGATVSIPPWSIALLIPFTTVVTAWM